MAESHDLKKLKYDGKEVVAEVAIRDGEGNIISESLKIKANKDEVPTITANNKNYKFIIKVVNGQPQLVYEEIA